MKTQVKAGEQDLVIEIHRHFDIPVESLFQAYTVPEYFSEWMGTQLVKWDIKNHGAYQFQTTSPDGNVVFSANGTVHEVIENKSLIRTFQMENTPFPAQLEFIEFRAVDHNSSELNIRIIFKTVEFRDQQLQMPFAFGLNMAHDRLQSIFN